jgi:biotin transporter BioY
MLCVVPFLLPDAVKLVLAMTLADALRKRIRL